MKLTLCIIGEDLAAIRGVLSELLAEFSNGHVDSNCGGGSFDYSFDDGTDLYFDDPEAKVVDPN